MWIVSLSDDDPVARGYCWGPFDDEQAAVRFAAFVTAEIDPASVLWLFSPVTEVLNWRGASKAREVRT